MTRGSKKNVMAIPRPSTIQKAGKHGQNSVYEKWLQDEKYRTRQTEIGCTEQTVHELDDLGKPHMSYIATLAERMRYEHLCFFLSNPGSAIKYGKNRTAHRQTQGSGRIQEKC